MASLNYNCSIPKRDAYYKSTKNRKLITEFLESGKRVAKIVPEQDEYKNVMAMRGTLTKMIKRMNSSGTVKLVQRKNELFIVNLLVEEG